MEVDHSAEAGPSSMLEPPPPLAPPAPPAVTEPYSYVVTAHRPSAVTASEMATFTGPSDVNLIISKCTRIEIHKLVPEGLQGIADVPIYGRIAAIRVFRPTNYSLDLLFVLTEHMMYFTLSWDTTKKQLKTLSSGDASERVGRSIERSAFAAMDPCGRAVALHCYDGVLHVLVLDTATGEINRRYVVRILELIVIDMHFLEDEGKNPVLAVLHEDACTCTKSAKKYEVVLDKDDIRPIDWKHDSLKAGAGILIPVSREIGGGVIIVAEENVTYYSKDREVNKSIGQMFVQCWGRVGTDKTRFLLGDQMGQLMVVVLALEQVEGGSPGAQRVARLEIDRVGKTTGASTISYLDSGVCFIGSKMANSQLVRLTSKAISASAPDNYVQNLQEFTNLGPILDFAVVDLDKIGQGQLVACCNTGTSGSLRLVRNGIGITEQASIELEGIRGVWSIKGATLSAHDRYLVITFVESTHVLAMNASDELDEASLPGFSTDKMTLFCSSLDNDQTVQVTQNEARLMDATTGALVSVWNANMPLAKVASTGATHVIACSGLGHVFLLESSLGGIQCVAEAQLSVEVSCIDISSHVRPDGSRLAAIGTWSSRLLLVSLPSMAVLHEQDLETTVLPRSVLFMEVGKSHLLLVGMGDGQLAHWQVGEDNTLRNKKKVSLGLKPVSLSAFTMNGQPYVFAATDRPAVVHQHNDKLVYSPLNEGDVMHLCTFSTESFPGALAMAKDHCLMITFIDAIQKLHIRTVPLGEMPRRIAYQASTATFAVITISALMDRCSVKILAQGTWEEVASLQLDTHELGGAICSFPHPNTSSSELFIVGTAYVLEDEPEPSTGRMLALELVDAATGGKELRLIGQICLAGSTYQIVPLPNAPGQFVATVNSSVGIFSVDPDSTSSGKVFELVCKKAESIIALYADVHGDTVLIGDMMQSVALYKYIPEKKSLDQVATEYAGRWTTAVAALSDTISIAVDDQFNMVTLRYNDDAQEDSVKADMERVGQFNVGDMINRIRPGSLVMQLPDSELSECRTYLMVSVLGMISLCIMLPRKRYKQLLAVQTALQEHIKGVGALQHERFRAHRLDDSLNAAQCCIDGDLVEQILDLPREEVEKILLQVPEEERLPAEEVIKVVEDLHRMH